MENSDIIERHDERYRIVEQAPLRRAEKRVIGCDYGATSYTTKTQADGLGRLLELGEDKLLLDVGSGAGWPGIYLAATTGARVMLTDIPAEGLSVASRRLRQDHLAGHVVAASGDALPLRARTFDAVTSSDVLC